MDPVTPLRPPKTPYNTPINPRGTLSTSSMAPLIILDPHYGPHVFLHKLESFFEKVIKKVIYVFCTPMDP